jgi:hypothetical protein
MTIAQLQLASSCIDEHEKSLESMETAIQQPEPKAEEPDATTTAAPRKRKTLVRTNAQRIIDSMPTPKDINQWNQFMHEIDQLEPQERQKAYADLKMFMYNKIKEVEERLKQEMEAIQQAEQEKLDVTGLSIQDSLQT